MLVGTSREGLVARITASFDEVCRSSSPRMWLLTAPSGWGKTRVVQELYVALAARQPGPAAYWPARIVDADAVPIADARKRISPEVAAAGRDRAAIPWLWWGTQAFRMGDGSPGRALEQGADQLYAHGEALIRAERSLLGTVKGTFDVTSATVGILALFVAALAAPPVAIPLAVGGGIEMVTTGASRVRELVRRRRVREMSPQGAAEQFEQNLTSGLADRVRQLSKAVPILLVIDDAHDADQVTVGVLDRLLRVPEARLLVVAMAWPDVIAGTEGRPLGSWLRSAEAGPVRERVEHVELEPLSRADLNRIVSLQAPSTPAAVCSAFASRYDNPLALRYVLELPRVRRRTVGGSIQLRPDEVAGLPSTLAGVFNDAWNELPGAVQSALAVAALCGVRFVPDLVVRAAQRQQLGFSREDLDIGAQTYRWTRIIDRSLCGFVELSFQRVAVRRAEELLGEDEAEAVLVAMAQLGTEADVAASLSYQAGLEVVASYIGLVESGKLPADSQAMAAAMSLAANMSQRGDVAGAEALIGRASQWAVTAEDRLAVAVQRAWLQALRRDYGGAAAAVKQALASEPEIAGQPAALAAQNDIALWLSLAGDSAGGMRIFQELVVSWTKALGPEDRLTLTARKNYVDRLGNVGRVAEARRLSEDLIKDLARVLGPNDTLTLIERGYHAFWVRQLEGPEAAADLVRDLVPALVAEIGPTMGPSLTNRKNLVHWLMESGRASEAEAACREAVADLDTYGSLPMEEADDLRITLAELDYRAGRPGAAAEEMARALDTLSIPLNDPDALQVRSNLAYCLWQDDRPSEALAVYRELLSDLPAGHPLRAQTIQNIATLSDR